MTSLLIKKEVKMSIGMRNETIDADYDSDIVSAQIELLEDYDIRLTLEEISDLMEEYGIDWECDIADCINDVLSK